MCAVAGAVTTRTDVVARALGEPVCAVDSGVEVAAHLVRAVALVECGLVVGVDELTSCRG